MRFLHFVNYVILAQTSSFWVTGTICNTPITLFWPTFGQKYPMTPPQRWMWPETFQTYPTDQPMLYPVPRPFNFGPSFTMPNQMITFPQNKAKNNHFANGGERGSNTGNLKSLNRPVNVITYAPTTSTTTTRQSVTKPSTTVATDLQQTTLTTTQDPRNLTVKQAACIRSCATDRSNNFVCGTDNRTYTNRQSLDCAQKCGKNVRLEYTGRCIPDPRKK